MKNEDYATAQDRLHPQPIDIHELMRGIRARLQYRMAQQRESLRGRGRLLIDPACAWRPTSAASTDVCQTMQAERDRLAARPKAKRESRK